MSLLPSTPDASPSEDAGPRVIGVDSEDADEVLAALSSTTARDLLSELHHDPAPPADLADRVDTSLQNAQYHLEKLENAGAIEVVDTAYSAKGREMDVYAPADQPLVIFAGESEDGNTLRTALSRLLGAVGILGVASLGVQAALGERRLLPLGEDDAVADPAYHVATDDEPAGDAVADDDVAESPPEPDDGEDVEVAMEEPAETPDEDAADAPEEQFEVVEVDPEAVDLATETAATLPPGLVFFLGGLFVLALVAGVLYRTEWR